MATYTQDFQILVQHDGQDRPLRHSFKNPDTARRWAKDAHRFGATTARVVHKTTGTVIFDGPAGIDLPIDRWYS